MCYKKQVAERQIIINMCDTIVQKNNEKKIKIPGRRLQTCRQYTLKRLPTPTTGILAEKDFSRILCTINMRSRSKKDAGPSQYTVYCIVNSSFFMNKGNLAASVARAFLELCYKVDRNKVKAKALDSWEDSGGKITVLKGINHKHLQYLDEDLSYAAVETYALYKTWGRSEIMLVLSALGREEDLDESLEGLSYLN